MTQDMFLKMAGIDGESSDSGHKNEIDVIHWEWQIKQASNMHSGSGGGSGKATISDLYFEHYAEEMAMEVTQEKADESLNSRIRDAENAIRRNVTQKLNQEQFDALTSFVYNTGPTGASETFRTLNDGDFAAAADVMSARTGSRQNGKLVHLKGLVIRRQEESAPFRVNQDKDKQP